MAIKINFDATGTPELPTMILAKKNGTKLGQINGYGIVISGNLNSAYEIQFEIDKYDSDGNVINLWDEILNFRLLWCKEWDTWFEITVEIDETIETTKKIFCTQLGEAELSQIYLYDIEINTEDDIAREDYTAPTILYNPDRPEISLLNRITEHAQHYTIASVDYTIMNIQRTFSFDNISIYDAFQEIAKEIDCIFILESGSNSDGSIYRSIKVYDLESHCTVCGYRGDYTGTCPQCGSTYISEGYGNDTTIFIEADELADEIQFVTDTGSVKNCFKLEAGDDLMTATIRNCNPNGSDRIWYFSDEQKADMTNGLVGKLTTYDELYEYYRDDYVVSSIPSSIRTSYNSLITKYKSYNSDLVSLPTTIQGYSQLMEVYYETVDFALYLQSVLMPDASLSDTTASAQARLLTANNFGNVAVADVSKISSSTADNAVLAMAKVIVDSRYQVKINSSSLSSQRWTGNFVVTNYSDEDDTATSSSITLTLTDDYELYLEQMIKKELNKTENEYDIISLFEMSLTNFKAELKKYCLDSLKAFYSAAEACLNILIEQGIGDKETWGSTSSGSSSNLYENLYLPYYNKLLAVESEVQLRENEIATIQGVLDEGGYYTTYGVQSYLVTERDTIQKALDFESYLGASLWLEFCTFRREDKYQNTNYISDGLSNTELFTNAEEFIEVASKELYKSAELQHSISASLKNLLAIDKFAPLVDYFELGNWLRIRVDDVIYKLRLIGYEIDYDNLIKLGVDFSDVMKTADGMSDKKSILDQAASMASSYDAVMHQSSLGSKVYGITENWFKEGLDLTNIKIVSSADNEEIEFGSDGLLFRKYDPILDEYEDEQLKIIHSTMAITDDNWETVRTAVGGFYYVDPETGQQKYAYGINGELLIGHLVLGENLAFYNENESMKFDYEGLTITNGKNTFNVSTTGSNIITISNNGNPVFYVDANGNAYLNADISAVGGTFSGVLEGATGSFSGTITSSDAHLGNWIIDSKKIYNDTSVYSRTAVMQAPNSSSQWVFAAGGTNHSDYSDCPFRVTRSGVLYAEDASLTGSLTTGASTSTWARLDSGSLEFRYKNNTLATMYGDDDGMHFEDVSSLWVGSPTETSYRFIRVRNSECQIDLRASYDKEETLGVYDCTGDDWLIAKEVKNNITYVGVYGAETLIRGSDIQIGSTTTISGSLISEGVISYNAIQVQTSDGSVGITTNSEPRRGLYDFTRSAWVCGHNTSGYVTLGNTSEYTGIYGTTVYVNGTAISTSSDIKYKSNVQPLSKTHESLLDKLSPRYYHVESDEEYHIGFVAQEVEDAMKEVGLNPDEYGLTETVKDDDGEDIMTIRYTEIIPLLVYEIQQLKNEINDLKTN